MSALGIYFGPKAISIVVGKGNKVLKYSHIALETALGGELEEKVPEEVKIVALLKEELRRNKIEEKEANLGLSGKDLIIRTFELPVLPAAELQNAINFEARKYIPFKVEDLVTVFQLKFDKVNRKNLALFVGIKKETLDKYLSILGQLNIKVNTLEYAGFSVLRLFKLTGTKDKGILGVINTDAQEQDEVNFIVLEDGFPLFSRDIILTSETEGLTKIEESTPGMMLEKLKTEIRISLDYYHRKFPAKKIEKVFFISGQDYHSDLEAFIKEVGLTAQFIDVTKFLGKTVSLSLSFIKGYSVSLSKVIKSGLKINLLEAKTKMKPKEAVSVEFSLSSLLAGLKVNPAIIIGSIVFCFMIFFFDFSRRAPLLKELQVMVAKRPKLYTVNPDSDYETLTAISTQYSKKIKTLDNLIKNPVYVTEVLNVLPQMIPEGVWLENLSFQGGAEEGRDTGKIILFLKGMAYLVDSDKEFELVNTFVSALKESPVFAKYFRNISITSLNREPVKDVTVTRFTISCQGYPGR